jgi:endoglucanase
MNSKLRMANKGGMMMVLTFKRFKTLLFTAVFLFTMIFSSLGSVATAAETSDFTQLNASQITDSMGAGINLGNTFDANINGMPDETAWGSAVITPEYFKKAKALGFKTIRIPVTYMKKIGAAPNYTIDANWLARIKQVVDYAYNEGLYVIINIHHDGAHGDNGWLYPDAADQTTIKAKFQKVWQQLANTFKDYNEHLIFESMNEVGGGYNPDAYSYSNLNAYNQIFVDTVRQTGGNNAARWLLIPGWYTDINFTANNYGFVIPTDNNRSSSIPANEKRIMISAHYYSPLNFCLGDNDSVYTQWGATADPARRDTWGQEDFLESQFKLMYDKFVTQGYPVVYGEYSASDKSRFDPLNINFREIWYKAVVSTAKKYHSVTITWDVAGGLLNDRANFTITPNNQRIINAIINASGTYYKIVNRNSGKLLDIYQYSTNDGAAAIQYTDNGGGYNQQWELLDIGGGYVEIINRNSGKALEIGGWSTTAGDAADQYTYGGRYSYNQQWQIINAGGGYVKLKNRNSGMLLDISGGNTGDEAAAIQWWDTGGNNQQWQLVQR